MIPFEQPANINCCILVILGNAGDALSKHRGMPFSTSDVDYTALACVASHPGGWWFENCLDSNLNGVFTSPSNSESTIFWRTFKGNIMKTEMKIQPYPQGKFHDNNYWLMVYLTPPPPSPAPHTP